jgi:hypothetical protein
VGGLPGQRQRAAYRPQFAGEGQFPGELVAVQLVGGDLAGGGEDAQGDREVEAAAFLWQVGRRQVDCDTPLGKLELPGLQCGAHAVPGFADFCVGQADQCEGGQAVGQMHLDGDLRGQQTDEGAACHKGYTHGVSFWNKPAV